MKKNLLITAALVATGASLSAQQMNSEVQNLAKTQMGIKAVAPMKSNVAMKAENMKAPAAVKDGVFYHRPEGTLYSGYTFGSDGQAALHVPALTDLTYLNGCSNPRISTWSLNGNDLSSYTDDENNLQFSYGPGYMESDGSIYLYGPWYSPMISMRTKSFELTPITLTGAEMMPMFRENLSYLKLYTGFTDGPAWGTGSVLEAAIIEQTDAIPQSYIKTFEKPASPICIESFELMFWTEVNNPLPAGKKITMNIFKLDEDGKTVGDPVETLYCENAEVEGEFSGGDGSYGTLTFAKTEYGVFGEELNTPIVIDYAFAIELFGHNEEGVNVCYRLADLGEEGDEYELIYGGPNTFVKSLNPDGTYSNYYWYNAEKAYGYVLPIQLNALYDKVNVETDLMFNDGSVATGCNVLRVSADGETVTTDGPINVGNFALITTALPFFALDEDGEAEGENYELVDCPDWLAFGVDTEEWSENYWNYIIPECEPLPEGVTGRSAVIYIQGQGYTSETPIIILQGDATIEGIHNIVADTKSAAKFNVAGQKVNHNCTGIVICEGKKMLKK